MTSSDPPVFDLASSIIHLGRGPTAVPITEWAWDGEHLDEYGRRFAADGAEGRLVSFGHQAATWPTWERHPAGEEVVLLLSGRVDLIQEIDGAERRIELGAGQGVVNPPGVWHTADVHVPGDALFITPGQGTEHRPR